MTRMRIDKPEDCVTCDRPPSIYKLIGELNTYKIECDNCGSVTAKFQLVEDALDAWNNGIAVVGDKLEAHGGADD